MANVPIANSSANISGDTVLTAENAETKTGLLTFDRDPSPPFAVSAGSAVVPNLNADMVDGQHASDLAGIAASDSPTITGIFTFSTNPVFNNNAIPETKIADGSVLARLADNEQITGGWSKKAGTSTDYARLGGILYQSNGSVGNSSTTETTLVTQAISANVLATDGDSVVIEVAGTGTNNANTKNLRLKWNGVTISTTTETFNFGNWVARFTITRTGSATQNIYGFVTGHGIDSAMFTTGTATLSGSVNFVVTGQSSAASNDIVWKTIKVFYYPA